MNTAIQALTIIPFSILSILGSGENMLAQRQMSLENRYADTWVNNVFKDNILLNLAYLNGSVASKKDINWDEIKKPLRFEFTLESGQTFAYHDDILPEYQGKVIKTTNAHFNAGEGFKTDGYLYGDGVCHLASLIYWAARDAKLDANSPVNHNFAKIPDVPEEYGVSIYSNPQVKGADARQNLYITNNKQKPVAFKFNYDGIGVKVSVVELN